MNAPVYHGYGSAMSPVRDARSAEAAVLRRITGRMALASGPSGSHPQLVAALQDNRRFWNQAAMDLFSDDNGLPQQLRATLLSLAAFTGTHTTRCLSGAATPEPLVAINTAVIRGLSGEAA